MYGLISECHGNSSLSVNLASIFCCVRSQIYCNDRTCGIFSYSSSHLDDGDATDVTGEGGDILSDDELDIDEDENTNTTSDPLYVLPLYSMLSSDKQRKVRNIYNCCITIPCIIPSEGVVGGLYRLTTNFIPI